MAHTIHCGCTDCNCSNSFTAPDYVQNERALCTSCINQGHTIGVKELELPEIAEVNAIQQQSGGG